jgi:hypothetical protein
MPPTSQCRAVRRNGTRCPNPRKFGEFCGLHFPKSMVDPKESPLAQRIGRAAEIVTIAAGSSELIKMLMELWHNLPFGPGPEMPDDYDYLENEIGRPSWRTGLDEYTPFNKDASSVDWRTARNIFDLATEILEDRDGIYSADESLRVARSTELSAQIGHLLDTMQEEIREMLCKKVGKVGDEASG